MVSEKTIEQARFIAAAGRKLKSRMFAIQSGVREGCATCKGVELSMAQVHTLMTIQGCGECTISNLANLLGVSAPSASCMVERLVDKGLLHRERSRKDRRKVVVRLSEQAARHMQKMEEEVLATFVDLVEKVGPETAEKWCEVFARVEQVMAAGEQGKVRDDE
ncbi:MAG: MarR family transcriptional regulator [Proteobacteria bacterium]|nr:MarR family transcriptional regulator [Pseudomonadota bacterium]MBU1138120.1 MarR family transcriptional regulator [Pseudomonadota bacterium]MBU1233453.1 MarR family transcriptional regulator [Pseudomonadota bacterium]MBU1418230.1 MarR family transcriptional regulator [Pseudomonadota bacterium]MBU1455428.1 MarR family transcriptional regulator [Pseudomonadota bacterium]